MRTKPMRLVKTVAAGLVFVQWLTFLPSTTMASSRKDAPDSRVLYIMGSPDLFKILTVLEHRIEDQQLLERTKGKLLALDQRQLRLIASLSERVAKEENTTGSDIAFLLMTALITLI